MIDLHTHTIFSDGEVIPSELVQRAVIKGYEAIALTDHVDFTNIDYVLSGVKKAKYLEDVLDIRVLAGVEITHVPPLNIQSIARMAKKMGAEIIVVHGETITEPVAPGTNAAVVEIEEVDILSHPGFITLEEAERAVDNDVYLEITSRNGHNRTNGHVARIGLEAGANLIVNTDTHSPDDLITQDTAMKIAMGAGLTEKQAKVTMANSKHLLDSVIPC